MYSRRLKTEERKNKRNAFVFAALTIAAILIIINFGIPAAVKFVSFLTELKQSGANVESSDTTPPPPPRIDALPRTTNQEVIEVRGSTEAGASVTISLKQKNKEVLADNEGRFYSQIDLSDGENTIQVVVKDNAGNESQKAEFTILLDKKSPDLEVTKPQEGSEFYGPKQRQIEIAGKTEEGSQIQINDRFVVVNSDGSFSFTTSLADGQNTFTIKAEDSAGNKTEKSLNVSYIP